MKRRKIENIKGLVVGCLFLIGIGAMLIYGLLIKQSIDIKKEVNKTLLAMIGTIVEQYPESESKMIETLSTISEQTVEKRRENSKVIWN